MRFKDSWTAAWEGGVLHIWGTTDLFPNDFSVGTLKRSSDAAPTDTVRYRIVFHRDKEPYCDKDRVGPVHYYDTRLPREARRLQIEAGDGDVVEIDVPPRMG